VRFDRTHNFHDLVGLRVRTASSFAADYFGAEYGPAAGAIPEELPIVVLHWTDSRLPRRPGPNYRLKIHKGLARWYYRLHIEPERILIEATGNRMAVSMVHHMLVHGCLRYLCSAHDAMMLHASALSQGGRSLLFAGSGGVGKTTVSSILLDQGSPGWELHADDYVFVGSAGDTYAYPSRSHLYADYLKAVPSASKKLSARQRVHLNVFGTVRRVSGDRIKWPLRVEPGLLWPDRVSAPHAQLQALLLLESGRAEQINLEPISDSAALVDQLLQVNFYEARHTIELIEGYISPSGYTEQWQARERETLLQALEDIPAYRLSMPQTTSIDRARLVSILQQLVTVEHDSKILD
jgi:hypothetical protein